MRTREVKLGDIITYNKGYAFKSNEYTNNGKMVVRVTDFTSDSISDKDSVYLEPDDKYKKFVINTNDILIQTVGSWANNPNSIVGKVVRVPDKCDKAYLNQNIVRIIPNKDFNNTYLYYALKANQFSTYCVSRGQGAANQASITLDTIFKFKFRAHFLSEQKRIAHILSAYDKLIENNNKRIKLLEQMAENLYKEWFVRFRYPGYEDVEFKDSPLGKIPTIFDVVKIGTLIDYYIGGGWGEEEASEQFSQEAFVVRGTDFPNVRYGVLNSCPLRYHKPSNYEKRKFEENDIAFEVSGGTQEQPVGRSIMITKRQLGRFNNKLICASFCKRIRCNPQKINPRYLYHWLQYMYNTRMIDQFQLQSTGIINFQFEYFLRKGNVLIPSKDIMEEFTKLVEPICDEIDILAEQNSKLIAQRDLLLPRLMSGKLEV